MSRIYEQFYEPYSPQQLTRMQAVASINQWWEEEEKQAQPDPFDWLQEDAPMEFINPQDLQIIKH